MPRYSGPTVISSARMITLLKNVIDQSIKMPKVSKFNLTPVVKWCESQFGPRRTIHPIYEIGLNHNFGYEGDWAYTFSEDETVNFWFKNFNDRSLFRLRWAGDDIN